MTDWKFIWNDFCDDVAKSVKKNDIERYFEKNIAKELLSACGWGKYTGLMEQYEIGFATTSGKADFALVMNKDSHPDVIIELKRPKNKKRDKYTKQLHDYMKQGECDFGILMLGNQMEIYYREHTGIGLVDVVKYEHNNEAAHYLIDLLTRENFSPDGVKEYCHDRSVINQKLDYWSSPEGIKRTKEMMALADNDLTDKQKAIFISSLHLAITRQTAKIDDASPIEEPEEGISNGEVKHDIDEKPTPIDSSNESQAKPRLFSQTTLVSYLRNFNSETTKMIVESMGVKQTLAQITDVDLLNKINEAIKVYEKQNGIHHTHSCAVSKYIEYINHGMTYQDFEHDAMLVRNGGKKPNPITKPKEKDTEKTVPRKAFEFSMIGLKGGDTITFAPLKLDVKINGKNTISYNGKTYTLTGFCKAFLPQNLRTPSDAYQGPKFFTYQGENLWKLRLRNEDKL